MSWLNWYSHQTKTRRKHWDGYGRWSKAHIMDGPYRERVEGERLRFLCGHETDALTCPAGPNAVMRCRRCLAIAVKRERSQRTGDR